MRIRQIAAVTFLLAFLPATGLFASEPASRYYPLKPGAAWTYNVTSDKGPGGKIVITNLAAREINGVTVTPRKWEIGNTTKYQLMATDSMGIYRYGEQANEKDEPVLTKPKAYSLRDPVATGTTWDMQSKMGGEKVTINLTVESVIDTVTVPAGTYKDCVKIKHVGGTQKKDLSLEAFEWYAPEVGLVKSLATITKTGPDKAKGTEHLTYQLESFKP